MFYFNTHGIHNSLKNFTSKATEKIFRMMNKKGRVALNVIAKVHTAKNAVKTIFQLRRCFSFFNDNC